MSKDVFISYSRQDAVRVRDLVSRIESAGVSVWMDTHSIDGGTNYGPEIWKGIRHCKVFLLMSSQASLRSRNVKQEIQIAWKFSRPYLPVLLDDSMMHDFPEQVGYWLEGWQWVEVIGRPQEDWLPQILTALHCAGVAVPVPPDGVILGDDSTAVQPVTIRRGLDGLRALARFTDQLWPVTERGGTTAGPALRDLGAPQDDVRHGFPLGSRVRLVLESEREGHLLLLDQGTSGSIYCLCPSRFAPDTEIRSGKTLLPQSGAEYKAFAVTGRPGREHLFGVISDEPLGLDWMPRDPTAPARLLSDDDLEALMADLQALDPRSWVCLSTYFDITL